MSPDIVHLIVNADDLAAGTRRDRGIFEAFRQGIVTSASILANGASFAGAAREALDCGLPLGVHLNLAEGRALAGPIRGLTDAGGHFPGKLPLRRYLLGPVDAEGILCELRAQVERVLDAGLTPDHLDTHQHFFLFPAATPLVVETARNFGIKALRRPIPAEAATEDPGRGLGDEMALYRHLAPEAAQTLAKAGLRAPEGLWGMPLLNRIDAANLLTLLSRIPPGVWELMVHPGYPDRPLPFSGTQRKKELSALCAPALRQSIRDRDIRLIHFGELPCVS